MSGLVIWTGCWLHGAYEEECLHCQIASDMNDRQMQAVITTFWRLADGQAPRRDVP